MAVEDAAELLPRVFNLCRTAQSMAVNAAFDLPLPDKAAAQLAQDILRDHVVKICVKWPQHLGLAPVALPSDWQNRPDDMRVCLFGPSGRLPENYSAFENFLEQCTGVGAVLAGLRDSYAAGEAASGDLPLTTPATVFDAAAQENSVAARQVTHPLMQAVEANFGRGPFWRGLAVALDIQTCLDNDLPDLVRVAPGAVVVPAARGLYGVKAKAVEGRVRAFHRTTPTDHLLTSGGIMSQALSTLMCGVNDPRTHLLVDILDPCTPVTVLEESNA